MPKIALLNNETGKLQNFEPIDAKEVLAQEGSIYSIPDESRAELGIDVGPRSGDGKINVPQLQGGDAEMQTGLSVDKYGRAAVVKAQPGSPHLLPEGADRRPGRQPAPPTDDIDEMTVAQLRDYAEKHNIDLGDAHLKADIVAKVKAAA